MTILNSISFFVEQQKWNQVKRVKHKDSHFEISSASLALQRSHKLELQKVGMY